MSSMKHKMNWSYVSAFLDADGCVMVPNSGKGACRLEWAQHTDNNHVLYEIKEFLAEHGIKGEVYISTRYSALRVYRAADMTKCCQRMIPWLRVKGERALRAIEFLEKRQEQRQCAWCDKNLYAQGEIVSKPRKFCSGKCRQAHYRSQKVVV
jgi:hypothetical protein